MKFPEDPPGAFPSDLIEASVGRLNEAIAMLDAIEKGDLLAELPQGAESGARHQCAVSLLAVLRRELSGLAGDLESAKQVHHLMARLARQRTTK